MNREQQVERAISRVQSTLGASKRAGMSEFLKYLQTSGFYESPSACKLHGAYKGGLVIHSTTVFYTWLELDFDMPKHTNRYNSYTQESMLLISVAHDLCKVGRYKFTDDGIKYNKKKSDVGHSLKSLEIIKQFIELTDEEEMCIKFHMGYYGTHEFNEKHGEYTLQELADANNKYKNTRVFHMVDNIAAVFKEE